MKRLVYLSITVLLLAGLLPAAVGADPGDGPLSAWLDRLLGAGDTPDPESEHRDEPDANGNRPAREAEELRAAPNAPGDERWADLFGLKGTDGNVRAMAYDGSGRLYVTGSFHTAGEAEAYHVAMWDPATSLWSALGSGLDTYGYSLAVDGAGNIYVGDVWVDQINNTTHIAKWDGSTWSDLGAMVMPSPYTAYVYALVVDGDGNLYAGGRFETAGGTAVHNLAMWDGSTWSDVGGGVTRGTSSAYVEALAVGGGNLYAGGYFTEAGEVPVPATNMAVWDGSAWSALGDGLDDDVWALALDGSGNLYAGGDFEISGSLQVNHVALWDGGAWSALGTGLDDDVEGMAFDGAGDLYVAGDFHTAGGVTVNHAARWSGGAWSALGSGLNNWLWCVAVDGDGRVTVGGSFTAAGEVPAQHVATWGGNAWSTLGDGQGMNGEVHALAMGSSGRLYAAGDFAAAGGTPANGVAAWEDGSWSPLGGGPGADVQQVMQMAVYGDDVYLSALTASPEGYVYRWDGEAWTTLGTSLLYYPAGLAVGLDGQVYVGATDGTDLTGYVARWDEATSAWSRLGGPLGQLIPALAVGPGGTLYAVADDVSGMTGYVAQWDGAVWIPLSSGGSPLVADLAIDDGGTIYAAFASLVDRVSYVARWDAASGTWIPLGGETDDLINALAIGGCRDLFAGGEFTRVGIVAANHIARWDTATGAWSALGSGVADGDSTAVNELAVDPSGYLYAGGDFKLVGGKGSAYIARWTMPWSAYDADFSWYPARPYTGWPVTFAGMAQGSGTTYYAWAFESGGLNGGTEGDNPAAHVYDAPGDYEVSMWAWNECTSQLVQHTVTVVDPPVISVAPGSLDAALCSGSTGAQPLAVCNEGASDLSWTLSEVEDLPWLGEDAAGGTLPAGQCQDVLVTFDAAGLFEGEYAGELAIDSNDPATPRLLVAVTLSVSEAPQGAGFTWSPLEPLAGEEVTFAGTAEGTAPILYTWSFEPMGPAGGQPEENPAMHVFSAPGDYRVTMAASNGCGYATAEHTVTVTQGNLPPDAVNDSATTAQDTAVLINATANDTDPDGNLDESTATVVTPPAHGSVINHGDGSFTYTPSADWSGTDGFTYQVCDTGGLCDSAQVAVTVTSALPALHVGDIAMTFQQKLGGSWVVKALIPILDASGRPGVSAMVYATWTLPNGSTITQSALTNKSGKATLRYKSRQTGTYQVCVTDVTKAGYRYDPLQNLETCDTVAVP